MFILIEGNTIHSIPKTQHKIFDTQLRKFGINALVSFNPFTITFNAYGICSIFTNWFPAIKFENALLVEFPNIVTDNQQNSSLNQKNKMYYLKADPLL